jgi:hypothetical protein
MTTRYGSGRLRPQHNSRLQSTAILPQMIANSWQTGERDND